MYDMRLIDSKCASQAPVANLCYVARFVAGPDFSVCDRSTAPTSKLLFAWNCSRFYTTLTLPHHTVSSTYDL